MGGGKMINPKKTRNIRDKFNFIRNQMFLSILNNQEKEVFLNLVINVAEIDGEFTQAEQNQISAYVLEMGITLKEKHTYNKSNSELLQELSKSTIQVRRSIFIEIVALMVVDGMKDEEVILLNTIQKEFNIKDAFKEQSITWYNNIAPLYKQGFDLIENGGK